ncbi:hypothetical protein TCAL_13086 [Tigriopus californicus]|uniref:Small acidic protein-like domain-containing protein n=2 Tax=Tigriopus californicus TaxID=6832 RepID=A0A553NB71_TIGCA|nr:arginine/serine-rich coiled-coil protein 2-like isoform X5 [Tigriopus californicus]XP_059092455.1 arginine/serine-rich coiled-coil protein 2-like isoform X5 [Tigriopus californicus]TRY62692.1 hypothetical protein TCAL_13086 [Tigriopus californicus]|eukprot:TCALIF_13086-PA protein Name:"Similar to rsrc2 Arginine/serine-rich coiled-coil protein 2 (Xenopus laevis)" AED:0.55 eAED:0.59 QI:0/-1/0/1/-1/1/1/0/469
MSKLVVNYSSGEDEGRNEDANYEEVGMDMSDENEESGSEANGALKLFPNKAEYKAYQAQFNQPSKKIPSQPKSGVTASEYGSLAPEEPSEYGSVRSEVKKSPEKSPSREKSPQSEEVHRSPNTTGLNAKEQLNKRKSPPRRDSQNSDRRSKSPSRRSKTPSRRSKSPSRRSKSPRPDHKRHHRGGKHRDRRRSRSRSRSRDHKRRSRSPKDRDHDRRRRRGGRGGGDRDRDRDRRRQDNFRTRMRSRSPTMSKEDVRNRKLLACGLTTAAQPNLAAKLTQNAQAQAQAQVARVKEITGVDLPKYYNPSAINPLKYAEQIKKRQMLWGNKKASSESNSVVTPPVPTTPVPQAAPVSSHSTSALNKTSFNKWEATNFGNNQVNEKFRRLMGIKGDSAPDVKEPNPVEQTQASLFASQEQQYERARAATHTQRGLGLGFSGSGVTTVPIEALTSSHDKSKVSPAITSLFGRR